MPTPSKFKATFRADSFYHILCKSIDGILLFRDSIDYQVFMVRFMQFNAPFLKIWSYSLLSNHSHHIVKVSAKKGVIIYTLKKMFNTPWQWRLFLKTMKMKVHLMKCWKDK
jgi:hypothetical protein